MDKNKNAMVKNCMENAIFEKMTEKNSKNEKRKKQ